MPGEQPVTLTAHAPIVLFVYNRPEHARRTLERLNQCKGFDQSPLVIYCDGPKTSIDADSVSQVRRTIRAISGKKAEIIEADSNQGLADSIIKGVTALCDEYGCAIVVEDDLLVSPYFLEYMNTGLRRYQENDAVMQISGHMFQVDAFADRREALFLPLTSSWGWATWRRAWQHFDKLAGGWEKMHSDQSLKRRFNLDGAFDYFGMLDRQMRGKSNSWAIRWYWSVFKRNGLVLFPPQTLVENIGFDGSGTHGWRRSRKNFQVAEMMNAGCTFPEEVAVQEKDLEELKGVLNRLGSGSVASGVYTFIKKLSHRGK